MVILISNITPSMNLHSKSVVMEASDGSFSLPILICGDRPIDGKEERFDCDQILLSMIKDSSLKVGDKIRCFGLYLFSRPLPGHDAWEPLTTEHYLLSQ